VDGEATHKYRERKIGEAGELRKQSSKLVKFESVTVLIAHSSHVEHQASQRKSQPQLRKTKPSEATRVKPFGFNLITSFSKKRSHRDYPPSYQRITSFFAPFFAKNGWNIVFTIPVLVESGGFAAPRQAAVKERTREEDSLCSRKY
jgi:hypothetical protein